MLERPRDTSELSTQTFFAKALPWCLENAFSYAVWKLPNSPQIHFAASDRPEKWIDVSLEEAKPGFLFSPFHPSQEKLFLPADEYVILENGFVTPSGGSSISERLLSKLESKVNQGKHSSYHTASHPTQQTTEKSDYIQLVNECKNEVARGNFEKIVPSRFTRIDLPDNFDLLQVFDELCKRYPNAMVTIFSSPFTGTWMGATPELLVSVSSDQNFKTVAVAGTQPYEGQDLRNVSWTQKDIEEQALVERYAISCFKKIRLREYEEVGPKTTVAGNVLHLKTEFKVDMVATNFPQLGTVMLKLLHPTSAVCGMPMETSLAFLLTHEKYDRQYYSGYLGPVNVLQETHLYVNLRCTQLFGDDAFLYAGAGVLSESDPEKEWNETEMKMSTLGKVIRQ